MNASHNYCIQLCFFIYFFLIKSFHRLNSFLYELNLLHKIYSVMILTVLKSKSTKKKNNVCAPHSKPMERCVTWREIHKTKLKFKSYIVCVPLNLCMFDVIIIFILILFLWVIEIMRDTMERNQ